MSNTIDPNNATLDDFNYFWMSNGAPCFIANNWDVVDNICETIESFGFQIYYLICDKSKQKTVTSKDAKGVSTTYQTYEYSPAILKVVNNFTGRVVMDSNDNFGNSFAAVEEIAEYTMPPIPKVIVDKLDEFFRLVDAQHHTESIVILTYDTTKEGSDGWGVLVPEQTNTSVHCKYDADSIAEIKPDHVMIVGSVHSHPGMAAYASGTDHADQADFDGVHITYGWQNSVNNGATQYHIELQIGGSAFTLKPEDVFETFTFHKEPDPEVVEWTSKVKKAQPLYTGGSGSQAGLKVPAAHNQSYQTTWAAQTHNSQPTHLGTQTATGITNSFDKKTFLDQLGNIPPDSIVAFEIQSENSDCLICNFPLSDLDITSNFCMTCDSPIITQQMGQYEILTVMHQYCVDRYLDPLVGYYVYCIDENNPMSNFLLNIKPSGVHPTSSGSDYEPTEKDLVYKQEYTVCCNLPVSMVDSCVCPKLVLEEDIALFDNAHRDIEIYDQSSRCLDCTNYYDVSCPSFRQSLIDFVTYDHLVKEQITECPSFVHYKDGNQNVEYISDRYSYYE